MPANWVAIWRRSLSIKIFLPTLLITALAVTLGTFWLHGIVRRDMEQSMVHQSQSLVQTLTYGVENLTQTDELERFLCVTSANRQIKGTWLVAGTSPHVMASSHLEDRKLSLATLLARWPALEGELPEAGGLELPDGQLLTHHVQMARELRDEGMHGPAHLFILLDHGPTDLPLANLARQFTAFRLILLLLLFISLIVVLHFVALRPLSKLSQQVQMARSQESADLISLEGNDEIGRLALVVKQALQDLHSERTRFELVAQRNPGLIYRCRNDADWTMEFMSGATLELTGYPPEDFIGNQTLSYESVIHPEDRDHVRIGVENGLAGDSTWDIEYRLVHADGGVRPVREQGRGHIDSRNGQWVLDGIILDLSVRHRQEELARQLLEADRMRQDGLRTMAGSVAHHVNNMLSGLMGGLELAKFEAEAGRLPLDDLRECLAMTERASSLGRLMLLYTGEGGRERQTLLAGPLVQAHLSARRRDGLPCPILEQVGEPTLGRFHGNPDLVKQLLDQLIANALEASPGKEDRIRLRAGMARFQPEELAGSILPFVPQPDGNPFVEILDEGEGMAPEVLERAFDPFFTTRFTGRGLGLAAVSGIARLHRAALVCHSGRDKGTRLTIVFPRNDGA